MLGIALLGLNEAVFLAGTGAIPQIATGAALLGGPAVGAAAGGVAYIIVNGLHLAGQAAGCAIVAISI